MSLYAEDAEKGNREGELRVESRVREVRGQHATYSLYTPQSYLPFLGISPE